MKSFVPLINEEAELNRQFPSGNELKQDTIFLALISTLNHMKSLDPLNV